jgi:hypothetical protein
MLWTVVPGCPVVEDEEYHKRDDGEAEEIDQRKW